MSDAHNDAVEPFALEDVCGEASVHVDRTECRKVRLKCRALSVVEPRALSEIHSARTFSLAGQGLATMLFAQKSSYEDTACVMRGRKMAYLG